MQFACPYKNKYEDDIDPDEYNIVMKHDDYDRLNAFLTDVPREKKINVKFAGESIMNIDKLKIAATINPNLRVRVGTWELYNLPELRANEIPFIFDSSFCINSYLLLDWAIKQGAEGLYIYDDLHYNLPNIDAICKKNKVELRIVLNRIPTSTPFVYKNKRAPIYRPQDMWILKQFFSVGEFDCKNEDISYDWEINKQQYKSWFIEQYWRGDLKFINRDVSFPIMSPCVPPELADYRSSCGLACRARAMSSCHKCERLYEFSEYNFQNGIAYKREAKTGLPLKEDLMKLLEESENKDAV